LGRRVRQPIALGVLLGALMLILVACSSAAPPAGVATLDNPAASSAPNASPSASLDPEAAMEAFNDCMRDHGVDIQATIISKGETGPAGGGPVTNIAKDPATGTRGTKIDKDTFVAAQRACESLLPQGGVNGGNAQIDPAFEQKLLDFAKCMRDHGVDMPDPQFSSSGGGGRVTIGLPADGDDGDAPRIDPESKTFQDAQAACSSILPEKFGNGGPTTEVPQ
jgi:hypothetical protein